MMWSVLPQAVFGMRTMAVRPMNGRCDPALPEEKPVTCDGRIPHASCGENPSPLWLLSGAGSVACLSATPRGGGGRGALPGVAEGERPPMEPRPRWHRRAVTQPVPSGGERSHVGAASPTFAVAVERGGKMDRVSLLRRTPSEKGRPPSLFPS